jgi:cardiolipin synthase
VRLFEWPGSMLHAKTAVIDDAWSVVGSYNFDHRSQHHQLESAAVVVNEDFARRLRDQTLADLAQCHEVTLEDHESRPIWRMAMESAAYLIRHWL